MLVQEKGKLKITSHTSLKIWSILSRINHTEFSGVAFFKIIAGSIQEPQNLVIELLDFYLMNIGSTGFTSFSYNQTELVDYYMANPQLIEDGVRTGCLHSHHTMGTFFSGEDVDDLVINTRDENVDCYLSVIVNTRGEWISRVAYRVKETIHQQIERKFLSALLRGKLKKSSQKFERLVLTMIDLQVEMQELDNLEITERIKALTPPPTPLHYPPYNKNDTNDNLSFKVGKLLPIQTKTSRTAEQDLKLEQQNDILLGQLMFASSEFAGGLDAAVNVFRRKVTDGKNNIFEHALRLHVEAVIDNSYQIVSKFEGMDASVSYTLMCLENLYDTLINEYLQDDVLNHMAIIESNKEEEEEEDPITIFCDILSDLMDAMKKSEKSSTKHDSKLHTHNGID